MIKAIVAVAVLAAPCFAAGSISFDRGISIRETVSQIKAALPVEKRVVRWIIDYKDVEMQPGQGASAQFEMSSTAIIRECTVDRYGERCRENFGTTNREKFRLVIQRASPAPDAEQFVVVLEGLEVRVEQRRVSQPYAFKRVGQDLVLSLAPAAAGDKRVTRWLSGWRDVTMQPGQTQSEVFELSATAMEEDCTFDPRGGMRCTERFGMTDRRKVQLVFENRPQVEVSERFDIVLEWHRLNVSLQQVQKPYDWKVVQVGDLYQIVFTPAK